VASQLLHVSRGILSGRKKKKKKKNQKKKQKTPSQKKKKKGLNAGPVKRSCVGGFQNVNFPEKRAGTGASRARYTEIEQGRNTSSYLALSVVNRQRFRQLVAAGGIDYWLSTSHIASASGDTISAHYRSMLTRLPELKKPRCSALLPRYTELQDDIAAALGQPEACRVIADFIAPIFTLNRSELIRHERQRRPLARTPRPAKMIGYRLCQHTQRSDMLSVLLNRGFRRLPYHDRAPSGERASNSASFQRGDSAPS